MGWDVVRRQQARGCEGLWSVASFEAMRDVETVGLERDRAIHEAPYAVRPHREVSAEKDRRNDPCGESRRSVTGRARKVYSAAGQDEYGGARRRSKGVGRKNDER